MESNYKVGKEKREKEERENCSLLPPKKKNCEEGGRV